MKKLWSKLIALMLGVTMALGVGFAVSSNSSKAMPVQAASPATLAPRSVTAVANQTDTEGNTWTMASDAQGFTSSTDYVHAGSGSKTVSYLRFSTTAYSSYIINSISLFGAAKASSNATLKIYVGGILKAESDVLSNTASSGGTELSWTNTDSASGEIKLEVSRGSASKAALYFNSASISFSSSECTHNWVAGTVHAPTCTEGGYTEYECSLCHETKQDDITTALGHNYGEWTIITPATCTEAGEKTRVCTRDSSHIEIESIPATGHHYVDGICEICGAEEPHAGTLEDPYTVSDARAAIDLETGVSNVYATGIVSEIKTEYNTQYENVSFNISEDGTTTSNQLEAYREKSEYSATVKVGDTVIIYGTLTKYGSTYEFGQNCEIVYLESGDTPTPVDPSSYFTQIKTTSDISDGKYAIVYDNLMFDGSLDTLDAVENTKELTLANLLTSYWTINNGKIKSASGYYIGRTADSNGLNSDTSSEYENTVSIDESGNLVILSSAGAYLRYNSASNQLRFRYYKSSSYTSQKAIQLYKVNLDQAILGEITCDSTGATPPQGSWSNLKAYYNTLSTTDKNALKKAEGAGLDRYDYIIAKYGTANYENFIGRTITPLSSGRIILSSLMGDENTPITLIVIISMVSISTLALFLLIKKRKYN